MVDISRVKMIDLPSIFDKRGIITSIEATYDVPFEITRIFFLHQVRENRGGHAHLDTDQVIISINGSLRVTLFDGQKSVDFLMDDATKGLYVPRLLFIELSEFSSDSVCLVLANTHYDIKKSIRNKQDYIDYLNSHLGE